MVITVTTVSIKMAWTFPDIAGTVFRESSDEGSLIKTVAIKMPSIFGIKLDDIIIILRDFPL